MRKNGYFTFHLSALVFATALFIISHEATDASQRKELYINQTNQEHKTLVICQKKIGATHYMSLKLQ